MYEQFKNQLLTALASSFTVEQLQIVSRKLDVVADNYAIKAAEKSLAVLGREEMVSLIKTYLVVRSMEGLSVKTLEAYYLHLKNFTNAMRKPIKEITANDIRLYLFQYQQQRGTTNRSLEVVRISLGTFFQWATNEKYLESNPMLNIKPIKYEKRPREALSQMDLEYVRRACSDKRETAIVEMLYSTGCRVRYSLTPTGKVIKKPCRKSVTVWRRNLKAFKQKVACGEMTMEEVIASHESHRGHLKHLNSHKTIRSMDKLFYELYGVYPSRKSERKKAS